MEHRIDRILATFGAAGLLAVAGCAGSDAPVGNPPVGLNPGTGDDDNGDDDDAIDPVVVTTVVGVVRDPMGLPLLGVTVRTAAGQTATTDFDGRFRIEDAAAGTRVVVSFVKDGYARSFTPIDVIEGVENTVIQTMAPVDLTVAFDAAAGADLTVEGATVALPAGAYVDADGNAYTGTVTVEATWYDLESAQDAGGELLATPGDFLARDFAGEEQRLESFGMLQVNLLGANGEHLNLSGATAHLRMPVIDLGEADVSAGDTIPAWSFDETTGLWIEEGQFTVVDVDGVLFAEFDAPHFSTWNCDQPLPTHGCVSGRVTDSQGAPRAGATVRFVGQTYVSTTTARTGQDGLFCVEVKNGETGYVEVSYTVAGQVASQRTDPVTIPAGQGTCTDGDYGDCVNVGDIPMDIVTCVSGVVTDRQGNGLGGVTVVSPQGGQAITGAGGSFCLTVPVFQTTDVFVLSDPQNPVAFQPQRTYAQPGLPACQNGCPNLVILRPYASVGCANGRVVMPNQTPAVIPVDVYDTNYPQVAILTGLTEMNGNFCVEIPAGLEVEVSVGDDQFSCGSQVVQAPVAGGTCGGSGQECAQLGNFNCNF